MDFNTPKYNAICKKLGFRPELQYVKITSIGTVEPTAGTRSEAFSLWKAVKAQGLKPSRRFQQIAKREGF